MRHTGTIRFTAVVAFVLFVQAQILLFMSAGAIEDGWGVDAGNVKAVAWVGIVAVVILTFLWVMLREEPLVEDVPQD